MATKVPRSKENDYTREMAEARRRFVQERTGTALEHVGSFSFDPGVLPGNVENFMGVAQVPIGLAGPLRIDGEHAKGDFFVPLATSEGTLVASYNRGMRLLSESGGVKTTVVEQFMQRSPVFILDDAQEGTRLRRLGHGALRRDQGRSPRRHPLGQADQHRPVLDRAARNLRFNYTTGDAAGQNMTGKATFAACEWIKKTYPGGANYILSGNMDTDKKHSRANMLLTRGKRVVAECTIKGDLLKSMMGISAKELFWSRQVSNAGAFLAGSANNGAHAANGLTAMFIATGQDVANVSESHAGVTYAQLLDNGDYYWSITLTSLIVATYGGGTGLPTQRECLEMLGCYGKGKADKFAEICAAVVLAGDTSLSSAILAGDWVSSHDELGRNRP